MTFDDDAMRLNLTYHRPTLVALKDMGMSWPPPERIALVPEETPAIREARADEHGRFVMRRVSMSQISDADRAGMTHVFRGAEYVYEHRLEEEGWTS